ncbi:hypothetical protein [Streptomyces sp. NBC_01578]|uniref:hypothetical protein n=1 Tax=Streptomyces sp. NBC_01578 TaxID=2975884 RepID=UPI00386BBAA1|nr:hypothetical protein OG891_44015 [Streptomyces sp. NBC_01637]WUC24897.1 hypothetical protein OHA33_42675 [Streptomyces sp. NBC_00562]
MPLYATTCGSWTPHRWNAAAPARPSNAFATAVERWPADGVPPYPGAWLTTTANRKAIDRLRRENKRDDKQKEAQMSYDDPPEPLGPVDDVRLIFTCCHV